MHGPSHQVESYGIGVMLPLPKALRTPASGTAVVGGVHRALSISCYVSGRLHMPERVPTLPPQANLIRGRVNIRLLDHSPPEALLDVAGL
jgi:hypothetical protein